MIPSLRNRAVKRLGISFLFLVLATFLLMMRGSGLPRALLAAGGIVLFTFAFVFYIQGNIALAEARGHDSSVVAAIIIVASLCLGGLFFAMPLILFFGLKDKTKGRRHSHATEHEVVRQNPPAVLPPRRDQ